MWGIQESSAVLLLILENGPDRERATEKFRKHSGRWAGLSQAQAVSQVRVFGGADEAGRLTEVGRGFALTTLANTGNTLGLY
jgi:hypothetical protein